MFEVDKVKMFIKEDEIYEYYTCAKNDDLVFREDVLNLVKYVYNNTKNNGIKNHIISFLINQSYTEDEFYDVMQNK